MLDLRAEAVLQGERGIRRGHAAIQQQVFESCAGIVGRIPAQDEGQHAQAAAGQVRVAVQRHRHVALRIRAEADHARALRVSRRRPCGCMSQQFDDAPMQRPAGSQRFGRIEMRGHQRQVAVAHAGHQRRKVATEQGREVAGGSDAQRGALRWRAVAQFQRDDATEDGGVRVVHRS